MGLFGSVARELRGFVRAALADPVPRDHTQSAQAFRRRRVVALATLVVGAAILAVAIRITPGDPTFYVATAALAVVWAGGGLLSGPLHLGRAHTRTGRVDARPWVQSVALGSLLVAFFAVGALVVARVPLLREPVDGLLDHARFGSLPVVAAVTAVNGVAEELYFRGGLYAAIGRRYAVLGSTAVYALATAPTGNGMLVFAASVLGLVCGLQRRVTGGVLGPMITHVLWSASMLFLLPPLLEVLR